MLNIRYCICFDHRDGIWLVCCLFQFKFSVTVLSLCVYSNLNCYYHKLDPFIQFLVCLSSKSCLLSICWNTHQLGLICCNWISIGWGPSQFSLASKDLWNLYIWFSSDYCLVLFDNPSWMVQSFTSSQTVNITLNQRSSCINFKWTMAGMWTQCLWLYMFLHYP